MHVSSRGIVLQRASAISARTWADIMGTNIMSQRFPRTARSPRASSAPVFTYEESIERYERSYRLPRKRRDAALLPIEHLLTVFTISFFVKGFVARHS